MPNEGTRKDRLPLAAQALANIGEQMQARPAVVEGTAQRLDELQRLSAELADWAASRKSHWNTLVSVENGVENRQQTLVATAQADAAEVQKLSVAVLALTSSERVRELADALQAATDERDGLRNSLTTYKAEASGALVLRDRERDARRVAEAALQRVRELRDELATPPRDPVHRGIPLPTVGRQFVLHRLDAALGVGVPTCPECRARVWTVDGPDITAEGVPSQCDNGHQFYMPHESNEPEPLPDELLNLDVSFDPSRSGPLLPVPENPTTETETDDYEYRTISAMGNQWHAKSLDEAVTRALPHRLGGHAERRSVRYGAWEPVTSVDPPKETHQ